MKILITKKGWFTQKWSFQLIAKNGKVICVSEKYYNESDMLNSINLIKASAYNCPVDYKLPKK